MKKICLVVFCLMLFLGGCSSSTSSQGDSSLEESSETENSEEESEASAFTLDDFLQDYEAAEADSLYLWVPDLESIDAWSKENKVQFSISQYALITDDAPISALGEEQAAAFQDLMDSFIAEMQLEETDKFFNNRIQARFGIVDENREYLTIYDDCTVELIRSGLGIETEKLYFKLTDEEMLSQFVEAVRDLTAQAEEISE